MSNATTRLVRRLIWLAPISMTAGALITIGGAWAIELLTAGRWSMTRQRYADVRFHCLVSASTDAGREDYFLSSIEPLLWDSWDSATKTWGVVPGSLPSWVARFMAARPAEFAAKPPTDARRTVRGYGWPWTCMYSCRFDDPITGAVRDEGLWVIGRTRAVSVWPMWSGLLLDTTMFGGAVLALVGLAHVVRRRWRLQRHRCATCGYSLQTLSTARCPECGELITSTCADHHPQEATTIPVDGSAPQAP